MQDSISEFGISYKNGQPKRVRTFNESEGRKRVKNVYKYIT